MVKIIDVAVDTTKHLDAFKRTSPELDAIIRYDDRFVSGDWKQVHLSEVKAIKATGLKLGIVYEDAGATPATFSEQTGYLSASYSRRMAKARGQPDSSAIYFAVDFDATRRQITSRIIPYFRGVERALLEANNLPKLRMGA